MNAKPLKRRLYLLLVTLVAAAIVWGASRVVADPKQSESNKRPFTEDFSLEIEKCTWVNDAGNLFFSLTPGHRRILEDDSELLQITVCDGTNCSDADGEIVSGIEPITVNGTTVDTRVIEEREWENGNLIEISHNFMARCEENGAIFYFGENVYIFDDEVVMGSAAGAWRAGVNGATPGIIVPGTFLLGGRTFQEVAFPVAADRGENVARGLDVVVEVNGEETSLTDCVHIYETSALSASDHSDKIYCPEKVDAGIPAGLVNDDGLELTCAGTVAQCPQPPAP